MLPLPESNGWMNMIYIEKCGQMTGVVEVEERLSEHFLVELAVGHLAPG